ncbi:MAG TPA: carboxylesterase/lipase family protein [Phenylobacterium sp.]
MIQEAARGVDRRRALTGAGALALMASSAVAQPVGPVARTRAGRVRGRIVDGVQVFQGVRYGASTEGRRFLPPRAPAPWAGVADAVDFGNQSPQLGAERPSVYASWANPRAQSEDCLFLNVYTPGLADGKARPVMVWFHGGGFTSGSASSHYADGTRLARRGDVVVVTVNHRLNAFGYLYLAHLAPELADSGNVGSLDMVLALQWVRDNIAEFGGDPGNVMIFGQSGGGGKVSALMAMPAAAGLFHKAVVQSGSGIRVLEPARAEESTRKVMAALGLAPDDVAGLQRLPMRTFAEALPKATGAELRPVVDGRALPRHPFDPDAPAISRNVPLLVGTAKDETTSLVGGRDDSLFSLTWEALPARLAPDLRGLDAAKVIAELRRLDPGATPSDVFFTATTEYRFRRRAVLQAERKAAQGGAPAYMYLFAWETPVDGGKWKAPHSVEHAMVFDNVARSASMVGTGPEAQKVADAVSSTWIRFARTGDPGWAPYTPERRATMVFDVNSKVVDDPRKAERLLFEATPI